MEAGEFLRLALKLREEVEAVTGIVRLLMHYGWGAVGAETFGECVDRVKRLGFTDIYAESVCTAGGGKQTPRTAGQTNPQTKPPKKGGE